ncbi:hypothetical protein C5C28_10135 [Rathayibacter rathayi]|nr:hypothetical protein C5C28_10135 [Rathayibacter rathayi]
MAAHVLGSPINYAILRYLGGLDDPAKGAHWGDIADALPKFAATSIRRHLDKLEETAVVTVDTPKGDRHGKSIRYSVDRERLELLFAQTFAFVIRDADIEPDVEL